MKYKYALSKIRGYICNPTSLIIRLLAFVSPIFSDELYLKIKYRLVMGIWPNLKSPKTFNEKLQWLKIHDKNPGYTKMVDKYSVKEYVAKLIGSEYIIPTLKVWDNISDISIEGLPQRFVIKSTHSGGGGGVVVCKDKNSLDVTHVKEHFKRNLKHNMGLHNREWPYAKVVKRVLVEEYIEDESYAELRDYKFFCFNGKVEFCKVDFGRFVDHHANYYSTTWDLLPFGEVICPPDYNVKIDRPKNFVKMIEIAERLAKDIPFIRIDLYNVNGTIYFGEMTFYPASGFGAFSPFTADEKIGNMLRLPN